MNESSHRNRLIICWLIIWLGYIAILTAKKVLAFDTDFSYAKEASFALFISLASLYCRGIWRIVLTQTFVILILFYAANAFVAARTFTAHKANGGISYSPLSLDRFTVMNKIDGITLSNTRQDLSRKWLILGTPETVSFNGKKISGASGTNWHRSSKTITVSLTNPEESIASFSSTKNNGFIYKDIALDSILAGRTFRFILDFKCPYDEHSGAPKLRMSSGQLFEQVMLSCTNRWETASITWTLPRDVTNKELRVSVVNLPKTGFDTHDFELQEQIVNKWLELPPRELAPHGLTFKTSAGTKDNEVKTVYLEEPQDFEFFVPSSDIFFKVLEITVSTQDLAVYELNHFRFSSKTGAVLALPIVKHRLTALSTHPNFDAHALTLLSLFLAFFYQPYTVLIFVFSVLALLLSASRGAWLTLYISHIINLAYKKQIRALGIIIASLLITTLAAYSFNSLSTELAMTRLSNSETIEGMSRVKIWSYAYSAFLDKPILGFNSSFESYIQNVAQNLSQYPSHAHNFWLQQAFTNGIFGLMGSLWLTLGLLIFALKVNYKRTEKIICLSCFLALNIFDNTFFYSLVLVTFIVSMNQFSFKD